MKRNLEQLELEALQACEFRGHEMTAFTSLSDTRAVATCWECKMEVMVNGKALPNEVDIGGEAVALNCTRGGENR